MVVESVYEHDLTVLVRLKRPDGGLEEVTLDTPELEEALQKATTAGASARSLSQSGGTGRASRSGKWSSSPSPPARDVLGRVLQLPTATGAAQIKPVSLWRAELRRPAVSLL